MRTNMKTLGSVLVLACATGFAQEVAIRGPESGMVYDQATRSLRAVIGVPGAAYLGRASAEAEAGSVAPDGSRAVLLRAGQLLLIDASGGEQSLGAWPGTLDKVAWGAGSIAVASGNRVQSFRLSPDGVQSDVFQADGAVEALAVGDDVVVVGTASGVYALRAGNSTLLAAAEAADLEIAGSSLFVADKQRGEIDRIANYADAPELSRVAGELAGLVGIALSGDGKVLLAAAGTKLTSFDAASGALLAQLDLEFTASGIETMGKGLFRLDGRAQATDPVQVASLADGLKVFFVPAGNAEE
ncbi:MAG: hypothetical protein IT168_15860 [Bryobacterales bacterium]|nr:hypothetical protein [Bryobacterales bacterium]